MASRLFAVDLDLGLNRAKQFVFEDFNSDPTSATGRVYFNTSGTPRLKVYNGSAWKSLAYTDDADNNTTYDLAAGGTTSPTISLTGSDSTTDTVTFAAGTGISLGQSTGTITITNTVTDTNTTYDLTSTGTTTASINLVPSSGATDSVTITGSGATSVSHSAGAITISSTDNNYYPTTFAWTGGTTAGPTGSLSGSGMTAVSYAAIPSASATASGIVTTAAQTFAGTKTFSDNIIVTGDLTVNGNTVTLNTATLSVEDNIVLLNNGVTGTPSLNAGIEVERGTSTNASITWDESADVWKAGLTGSEVSLARKYVETITTLGGTPYTVIHSLATSDVLVQTYVSNSLVDCDIDITDANSITVTTNASTASIRVVVIG